MKELFNFSEWSTL